MIRTIIGTVVSNKMNKTLVVKVDRLKRHPKYKKLYRVSKKFYVHDEKNEHKIGDVVTCFEHRPLSKLKRWTVTPPEQPVNPTL